MTEAAPPSTPDRAPRAALRLPTALLISGGGRTALNLLRESRAGSIPIAVVGAVATRADCVGVERLRAEGVQVEVVARREGVPIDALHDRTDTILRDLGAEFLCLCGWLRHFRVTDPRGGADWSDRVLNIHPSLLPAFGGPGMHGLNVHRAVLAAGATESGCTVHVVDPIYDHGRTVLQRRVSVRPDDTPESLAARVFEQELVAYPEAVRRFVGADAAGGD